MENNTSLETTDKTNIVTYGENAVGVLACSSPGESRTCVDAVDDEVCDSNSYEVISRADLKMNGGSITTNGINSYGTYANGNKAYINLDYVVLETVADGSYAVAIRQGNIDIKVLLQQMALKPPLQKYTMVESDFFQCHFRINRNAYPRPATRRWQLRRQPGSR